MACISLRNVEKHYGDVVALANCNLDIADHEFVVLVGPSGSGKTTLLRIIAGLESVSGGDVYFDDLRVNDIDVGDRDIAMVFQNYGLYPHMTVYANMAFGLRRRRMPVGEIDRQVRRAAKMLSIEPLLGRRPRQLSGGQRQRVALGRAIVREPAVFLLDEPLSNLDAHLRVQMRSEILKVHRAVTATAVYVTHDQVEALTMGDRIAVMNDGRIHQIGTAADLYDSPVDRFVASFIGTPAMGFLTCRVERYADRAQLVGDGVRAHISPEHSQTMRALGNRERVIVGIRPERLIIPADGGSEESEVSLRGAVEAVEVLGAEQYVHVVTGAGSVTARVPKEPRVRVDEKVALGAACGDLYLFDHDTGSALV
jgi:multiple sugar transport system ATP-binding protein